MKIGDRIVCIKEHKSEQITTNEVLEESRIIGKLMDEGKDKEVEEYIIEQDKKRIWFVDFTPGKVYTIEHILGGNAKVYSDKKEAFHFNLDDCIAYYKNYGLLSEYFITEKENRSNSRYL